MWSLLLAGIKKYIGGDTIISILIVTLILLTAFIVIPNMDAISHMLGFETKASIQDRLSTETHNTNTAVNANANLNSTIAILEGTAQHTAVSVAKQDKDTKETTNTANTIKDNKDKKISSTPSADNGINISLSNNVTIEEIRISTIQINAVWEAYCKFNVDTQCGEVNLSGA